MLKVLPRTLDEADGMKAGSPSEHGDEQTNEPQASAFSSGFFSDSDAGEDEECEESGISFRPEEGPMLSESEISQQVL
jgi:hypothetical protein